MSRATVPLSPRGSSPSSPHTPTGPCQDRVSVDVGGLVRDTRREPHLMPSYQPSLQPPLPLVTLIAKRQRRDSTHLFADRHPGVAVRLRGCVAELRDLRVQGQIRARRQQENSTSRHHETRLLERLPQSWTTALDSPRRFSACRRSSSHRTPLQSLRGHLGAQYPMLDKPVENAAVARANAMANCQCARCASATIATVFTTSIAAQRLPESS